MRKPLPVAFTQAELAATDPRWRQVVEQIGELQRRDLSYWETFSIEIPPSVFRQGEESAPLGQLFQAPTDDELEAVA